MKKVLATTLALATLLGAMTLNAGAAYSDETSNVTYESGLIENTAHGGGRQQGSLQNGDTIGTGSVPVKANVTPGGSITHVYAISIETTELSFNYGNDKHQVWNPDTLSYDVVSEGTTDGWTAVDSTITIANYSDLPVDINAKWTPVTQAQGVTATIVASADGNNNNGTTGSDPTLKLASAIAVAGETSNTARKGTFEVTLSGTLTGVTAQIGTIDLTIKVPAG